MFPFDAFLEYATNRTNLELKQPEKEKKEKAPKATNRTNLELKLDTMIAEVENPRSTNRTNLELKLR